MLHTDNGNGLPLSAIRNRSEPSHWYSTLDLLTFVHDLRHRRHAAANKILSPTKQEHQPPPPPTTKKSQEEAGVDRRAAPIERLLSLHPTSTQQCQPLVDS